MSFLNCDETGNCEPSSTLETIPARRYCADVILPTQVGKLQSINDPALSDLSRHRLQAAYVKTKAWPQFYNVKIMFMGGTKSQKNTVVRVVMSAFQPLINLRLTFHERGQIEKSDVRVTFDPNGGAWSYLGTDAWNIPQSDATMNLGWLDESKNFGVIKHEFGHCLGPWIHEHQNPDKTNSLSANWNTQQIIRDLSGPPNNWDMQTIHSNMFEKYDIDTIRGTEWDPTSIMQYFYPSSWTKNGTKVPVNQYLSETDKEFLANTYPIDAISEEDEVVVEAASSLAPTRQPTAGCGTRCQAAKPKSRKHPLLFIMASLTLTIGLALIVWGIVLLLKRKTPSNVVLSS